MKFIYIIYNVNNLSLCDNFLVCLLLIKMKNIIIAFNGIICFVENFPDQPFPFIIQINSNHCQSNPNYAIHLELIK